MAELEEELIGDDLDYEYDLDEEEEEALLAGEVPSHEVNVEDIIELGVEDDFGGEEDGGHISHSKGVHSRLQHPNRLQTSGRLQHANARYGDDEPPQNRLQASGRLQPPSTVYEEEIQPQNRLQASGRLQAADTVYEEEEIQDSYDASMNDEPVAVHIQDETQNVLEEEEEEDEDEDDGGGRDRFKSERSKISITNTPTKRVIPDSLDQVQVKEQLTQKVQGGRGRGRGGFMPRGGMRGGQRGGRGGQMGPPLGWQGGRGMPMPQPWPPKSQQQQPPPLMMNPPSRMNMARGQGGLPGMGRPNIYSLFGPGPPASQGQNQLLRNASPGNFSLMGNVPWSAGVGPFNAPGILSQLIPRPQIPPPEDMRNLIKKRGINDPMMGSPSKQMKMNQGPINNQHMPPNQNMTPNQHMSPQRGGMVRKPPVTSRLSMPAPSANPNLTTIQTAASNVNPNLTTIKTVDINAVQQKNFQNKPQQNQPEKTPQNVNQISQQMNKPPVNQFEQKPVQNNQTQQNHMSNEQDQPSKVQDLNSQSKSSPEKEQVPLTPEDVEYQKKLEQQKKLREEMLAKKEARRKAAANEMAKKKAEEEKKNVPPTSTVTAEANKPNQQQQQLAPTPQPQSVKKDHIGVIRNDSGFRQDGVNRIEKKSVIGKKNPVSFINEISPGCKYIVTSVQGPSNMPTFTILLVFNGQSYTASGQSKKLAKKYVAEAAVKAYLKTEAAMQHGHTEDMIEFSNVSVEGVSPKSCGKNLARAPVSKEDPKVSGLSDSAAPSLGDASNGIAEVDNKAKEVQPELYSSRSVVLLNQMKTKVVYQVVDASGMPHKRTFVMKAVVDGQSFEGSGPSKKVAKAVAASKALKALQSLDLSKLSQYVTKDSSVVSNKPKEEDSGVDSN